MKKPIYIQPSINLSIKEQIEYNLAWWTEFQEWEAEQNNAV